MSLRNGPDLPRLQVQKHQRQLLHTAAPRVRDRALTTVRRGQEICSLFWVPAHISGGDDWLCPGLGSVWMITFR